MRDAFAISICLAMLVLSVPAMAASYRIAAIVDGDTIIVEPAKGGDRATVRLYGIDAPELDQPHGTAARLFLMSKARFKRADVRPTMQDKDRYGRIVAIVEIPGVGILQEMLLKSGLAWVYPQYCTDCGAWDAMQEEAKKRGKGLWARGEAVEPWEWRRGK
ncbi:MAG: thermonuclease family protein [Deltaproteobacteria bacterium]|nr:thermonuclease family protein [Deltaproteobacteria bacterium]